jgi:Domain of unknown function (DUF4326)
MPGSAEERPSEELAQPSAAPVRVTRSRRPGYRMPPNTVVVSRPSKYANPHRLPDGLTGAALVVARIEAVAKYKRYALRTFTLEEIRADLAGRNLACWCKQPEPGEPDVCHAALLLRWANGGVR